MEGNVAQLPVEVEATEDTIADHIKRCRDYALANPCVFDDDFIRIFGEGRNRALFTYTKSWLVSIIVSVAADEDFSKLFWQVSTSLVSAFNGKARSITLLGAKEQRQLVRSRDIVMHDVSEIAGLDYANADQFHQQKAFHAICDLSDEETAIAAGNMTAEQQEKMGLGGKC